MANRLIDAGNTLTIAITLVLFATALFSTGFTHDLLLEAGVFLVSVKLILLAYKHQVATESVERQLEEIRRLLERDQVRLDSKTAEGAKGAEINR